MRSMVEGAFAPKTSSCADRFQETFSNSLCADYAQAPSTALRAVPLPRFRGGGLIDTPRVRPTFTVFRGELREELRDRRSRLRGTAVTL